MRPALTDEDLNQYDAKYDQSYQTQGFIMNKKMKALLGGLAIASSAMTAQAQIPVVGGLLSGLPVVGGIVGGDLLGGDLLGGLPIVGGLAGGDLLGSLPVVGGLAGGDLLGGLPVVGGLAGGGLHVLGGFFFLILRAYYFVHGGR